MLRLDKVIKPWKESAALNDHINLYGFWTETAFLTKSGDLGMVLSVPGVDYESLDRSQQEYAVKRLEAALKAFDPGFHVYQYLFKSNRPDIPFAKYDDPIVEAAIEQRRRFFEAKRDHLYQIEIFYCILLEGARSKTGVGAAIARILRDPAGAVGELKVQFTNDSMKTLLRMHIERDLRRLDQSVQAFAVELSFSEQIAPAKGLSYGGKITLLSGMQPAEEFSTLVHEIAHEMLHRGDRRTLTTKQVRETEAEAVAFVVCQSVGLQNGTASQDYVTVKFM